VVDIVRREPVLAMAVLCAVVAMTGCASGNAPSGASDDDDDGHGHGGSGGGGHGGEASHGGAGGEAGAGGATVCDYPTGETGVLQGMLVDGALAWEGIAASDDAPATVTMADYYDCDGTKGINALLVIQSATWCAPCQADAATLEQKMQSSWSALGIRALTLMVEDGTSAPATVATAQQWKDNFGLDSVDVAADPDFSFRFLDVEHHIDEAVFPTQIVIDPRTMTIAVRDLTDADIGPQLEALASANQ
jgi:hypothetical protein